MSHPNFRPGEQLVPANWDERRPDDDRMPGGSPVFPTTSSKKRTEMPVTTGCFDYFALALLKVAAYSRFGNIKHNGPDAPLHWAREKSTDHANNVGRHLLERGTVDPDTVTEDNPDGFTHTVALAWRALALLQKEEEARQGYDRDAKNGEAA